MLNTLRVFPLSDRAGNLSDFTFMVKPCQFHLSSIIAEANSESFKISKITGFEKLVNSFAKQSIFYVLQGFEYTSE